MKEEVKSISKPISLFKPFPKSFKGLLLHILSGAGGIFAARVQLLSALSPLGIVLSAAMPLNLTLTTALGSFLGYLFMSDTHDPFRYTAALFATMSLRMLAQSLKKISEQPFFCAFGVLASVTVCNLVTCMQDSTQTRLL